MSDTVLIDRSTYTPAQTIETIWEHLNLPLDALTSLSLTGSGLGLPSSFKIGHLAQSTIALSALAASLVRATRDKTAVANVTVNLRHACAEYKSVRLYTIDDKPPESGWGPLGGLHPSRNGYVRIHDSFPNHRQAALDILGLAATASRNDVSNATKDWDAVDLETAAHHGKAVIAALRTYAQWDVLPQAKAVSDFPVFLRRISDTEAELCPGLVRDDLSCLRGLRVLDLSRVIAAPLAGRVLAAHGADVLWVTSPNLPDQPALDRDLARGKRTIQLDIKNSEDDRSTLRDLVSSCDVFLQGYRPQSLSSYGFSPAELLAMNPRIVIANMSAYGTDGPWADKRGFDSLVQTCSGMNVSEAQHAGHGEPARLTSSQPLDYGGGYLLATGIMAALYHQSHTGGAYQVDVSLAGVMKYLRSLGQLPGDSGFQCEDILNTKQVMDLLETRNSLFGELRALKHPADIQGARIGFDIMPKPLGSDSPVWLQRRSYEEVTIVAAVGYLKFADWTEPLTQDSLHRRVSGLLRVVPGTPPVGPRQLRFMFPHPSDRQPADVTSDVIKGAIKSLIDSGAVKLIVPAVPVYTIPQRDPTSHSSLSKATSGQGKEPVENVKSDFGDEAEVRTIEGSSTSTAVRPSAWLRFETQQGKPYNFNGSTTGRNLPADTRIPNERKKATKNGLASSSTSLQNHAAAEKRSTRERANELLGISPSQAERIRTAGMDMILTVTGDILRFRYTGADFDFVTVHDVAIGYNILMLRNETEQDFNTLDDRLRLVYDAPGFEIYIRETESRGYNILIGRSGCEMRL
ncbi:hypothetical protein EJ05DRAFT_481876 [Pseudovirgaria hyperparasitica]|uniref:CoA-transferase family III n=1 Tax=Pseudovirgaria hyperparasitica TaxID=470096 RepID=A0A6A6WLE1_9PEZI|nr:uncharacterized protein EJ05DRAFT_481876 [Pseudovirgaria hyperparasitica]KAF2763025.1 hypothetical protein EJ05DRAFT_481876 [Pseudovirgaria hyperparasitica]